MSLPFQIGDRVTISVPSYRGLEGIVIVLPGEKVWSTIQNTTYNYGYYQVLFPGSDLPEWHAAATEMRRV